MSWWEALLLGVLQGQTEFLPVSSSGHLVVLQKILNIKQGHLLFEVAVHLGTLLTVLVLYRHVIFRLMIGLKHFVSERRRTPEIHLIQMLVIGSVPTAFIGFAFKDSFERLFSHLGAVGFFFLVTGVLLYISKDHDQQKGRFERFNLTYINQLTVLKALLIGSVQGLAIAPGVSRSGSTIAAGMLLNIERNTAAMYSFLLSIPAICGATLLQARKIDSMSHSEVGVLLIAVVAAFFSGLLGLKVILRFVNRGQLRYFSYYLWLLGVGVLLWSQIYLKFV